MKWQVEKSKYIVNDQWIKLRADRCSMPNGTILDPYYVVEHCDWVNVVAVTGDSKVIMVTQYRHGIGDVATELPAGCIDDSDSSPEATIRRELLEETGYTAEAFVSTGSMPLNTSNHNNRTHCFLAIGAIKVQDPTPEETEQLEISELSFDEMFNLIDTGKLQSLHTASFLLAMRYLSKYDLLEK